MTLVDVLRARQRLAPYLRRTPLVASPWLSALSGARVSLKLESLQRSNSFKSRGAFNAVMARVERGLPPAARLVTASSGNHGRALAEAAATFGLPLVVFAPADTAKTKVDAIRRLGAELRLDARDYDEAERLAKAFAASEGASFISPYNDADVIAGAATIALELFEDAPATGVILVPIGGGGLISGVAAAAKSLSPACEVIGVEAEASSPFRASVQAERIVEIVPRETLADAVGGNVDPDTITFAFIRQFVDRIVTVSEEDLAAAIAGLVESEHLIAEGAGAAATAALVGRRVDIKGREAVAILSGANIDRERLARILA
jgi:threonine dehydratase